MTKTRIEDTQIEPGSGNTLLGTNAAATADEYKSLLVTTNQIIKTDGVGTITLSTPQDIATSSTPTFASETLTATTNQLILGTTRTITLTAPTPATSSRTWTIPDLVTSPTFAALEGTQTFTGTKTLDSLTLGGDQNANSHKITTLAAATANGDAVRWEQVVGQRVLQIISVTSALGTTTTSNTYQSTNLTASITPASTANKILVLISGEVETSAIQNSNVRVTLFRNATDLLTPNNLANPDGVTGLLFTQVGYTYLDSPSSTSSLTYTVKVKNDNNATSVSWGGRTLNTMYLCEIG